LLYVRQIFVAMMHGLARTDRSWYDDLGVLWDIRFALRLGLYFTPSLSSISQNGIQIPIWAENVARKTDVLLSSRAVCEGIIPGTWKSMWRVHMFLLLLVGSIETMSRVAGGNALWCEGRVEVVMYRRTIALVAMSLGLVGEKSHEPNYYPPSLSVLEGKKDLFTQVPQQVSCSHPSIQQAQNMPTPGSCPDVAPTSLRCAISRGINVAARVHSSSTTHSRPMNQKPEMTS
jgi:hypothetical protein